jgi:hypothetical protein
MVWGLDKRFLGRKWQKKNIRKRKRNRISRFDVAQGQSGSALRPVYFWRA